jgi:hypothetical protein
MALPDIPISGKDIIGGAVTFQKRLGGTPQGKASERRLSVTFPTANVPVPFQHGLGRKPTTFSPANPYAAGTIYCDRPLRCDTRTIVLYSSSAALTAELIVR